MSLSLVETLAAIPDPRSRRGRRYPLSAVLSLVTFGLLVGRTSLDALCRLGHDYGPGLILALGFPRCRLPAKSMLSRLLRRLDADAVENALARWIASRLPEGVDLLSLDGKTARGSKDGDLPGQHLVAAYAPQVEAVLGQFKVDAKTNEHKAALQLLGILPVPGKVVTGDALLCQRDVAAQIIDRGGDYVFVVKKNQPGLETDVEAGLAFATAAQSIAAAFSPSGGAAPRPSGDDGRQGARASGEADVADDDHPDTAPLVAGVGPGL